jgi:hypothetical protein
LFSWTPDESLAGTVPTIDVRVTDDGTPVLSDDSSFDLTLVGPLEITSQAPDASGFRVDWFSIPGATYQLQYTTELPATLWNAVAGDVTASGNRATQTDPASTTSGNRIYRVEQVGN